MSDPASPKQPSQPVRSTTPAVIDLASKAAVTGSLVAYLVGFLVAVPHYTKFGVPVSALSHQTYLITGLSWLVVTGTCLIAGLSGRRLLFLALQKQWARAEWISLGGSVFFPVFVAFKLTGGPSLWNAIYIVGIVVGSLGWELEDIQPPRHALPAARLVLYFSWLALLHIGLFSGAVFHSMPVEYGGAPPKLIVALPLDADGRVEVEHDKWADITCRKSIFRNASFERRCRRIYQVYESPSHLYLLLDESVGRCEISVETPRRAGENSCLIRLAQDRLPQLEVSAGALHGPS